MIHFDFIVSDEDAEIIMGCISSEINNCRDTIAKLLLEQDIKNESYQELNKKYTTFFKNHLVYLKELKLKMKNTREV